MAKLDQLAPSSKVWIYQSSRELSFTEALEIEVAVERFTDQWSSHRLPLSAAGEVRYNRFIILAVDEQKAGASGCSIDSSVRFIKTLEDKYRLNLFDRMAFAYEKDGSVEVLHKDDFSREIELGHIGRETLVFNNLVKTISELKDWKVPFSESWHTHFFAKS